VVGEPVDRAGHERGGGVFAFVAVGFDVGDPGSVIDGDVEVVVAQPSLAVCSAAPFLLSEPVGVPTSVEPPAAPVGDPALFLDSDVE
jgi:hypothetical protein